MRAAAVPLLAALLLVGCGGGSGARSTSSSTSSSPGDAASTPSPAASTPSPASSTPSAPASTSSTTAPRPPGVPPGTTLTAGLRLSSDALGPNAAVPPAYTCDGRDVSLPVQWTGVPPRARELVLVMRDPDASTPDFVHWALAGISPAGGGFPAGAVRGHVIPGRNSFGALGYRGPCPPHGRAHHYVLTLIALGVPSGLQAGFSADQLRAPALAIATLVSTYARR